MAVKLPLQVILSGIDRLSGPLRKGQEGLRAFGAKLKGVGRGMSTGFTLPVVAAAAASVSAALGFDQAINSIQANSRSSLAAMAPLREEARRLGRETLFTSTEAAQGMDFLSRAGADVNTVLRETPAILALAAATSTDLALTADKTTDIMRSQGMEIRNVMDVADSLTGGVTAVTQTMEDLAEAFKLAGPQAAIMQIPFDEVVATLSALADAGLKGGMGGTAFARGMQQMLAITPDMKRQFDLLGLARSDFFEDSGKFRGPINMLDKLNQAFHGNAIEAQKLFTIFEARGARGLGALFISGAGDNLRRILNQVVTGDAQKAADTKNQGAVKSFKMLANSIVDLGLAIAESGILDKMAEWADRLSGWLNHASAADRKTVFWTASIILMTGAVGPLLLALGSALTLFAGIAAVVGISSIALLGWILVLGLLVVGIWWLKDNWDLVVDGLKLAWLSFVDLVEFGVNKTVAGLKWMGRQLVSAGGLLPDSFVPGFLESDTRFDFGGTANFEPSRGSLESLDAGPFGKGRIADIANKLEVLIRTDAADVEVKKLPGSDADDLDVGIVGLGLGG